MAHAISQAKVDEMNAAFELAKADPENVLRWMFNSCNNPVMSCGPGFEGSALIHIAIEMSRRMNRPISFFTIDTGFSFPESLDLISRYEEEYDIAIRRILPNPKDIDEFDGEYPPPAEGDLDRKQEKIRDACCDIRKNRPFIKAIRGFDAWLTATQRCQGGSRSETRFLSLQKIGNFKILKVCPLAFWDEDQTWAYIKENNLPYNPLHDQDYGSVGCTHCTEKGKGRIGRFPGIEGIENKECGIHTRLTTITKPSALR